MAKVSPEAGAIDKEDIQIFKDEEHALFQRRRQKYAEIHGAQGCIGLDFRKTPTFKYLREAAGEGRLMWWFRHHLHFVLTLRWRYLVLLIIAISVVFCLIFGGLLQLAAAIDHAISQNANLFATEENEGIPLYDGRWGYGGEFNSFLQDYFAPWFKGFMLSVQTFLTIGYGVYSPDGVFTQIVIIIELGLGLVLTAIVTGLPYLKFSIPYPAFEFSKNILVTWFNDEPTLKLRFGMKRMDRLTKVRIRMDFMLEHVTLQGVPGFTNKKMELVSSEVAHCIMSCTVQHVLRKDSPLFKFWKHQAVYPDKISPQPFVQVTILAVDHNYQAEIQDTHIYSLAEDLKFDYVFKNMQNRGTKHYIHCIYDNLHLTELWKDPKTLICDMRSEEDPSAYKYPVLRHAKMYQESLRAEEEPCNTCGESKTQMQPRRMMTVKSARMAQRGQKVRSYYTKSSKNVWCCQRRENRLTFHFEYTAKNSCCRLLDSQNLFWGALKLNASAVTLSAFVPLVGVSMLMTLVLILFDEGCHGFFSDLGATGVYPADTNCTADITVYKYYSDLFYFSMQTVSTVGYGGLAPYTAANQIISAAFGLLGFVVLAFWCGWIFAVYAQSPSTFVISKFATITTRNTERRLEFRVASAWAKRPIVRASAKCFLYHINRYDKTSHRNKAKGSLDVQSFALELENDGEHPFLRFPATFAHVIKPPEEDPKNPLCLYDLTQKDWVERGMGLALSLKGWDTCLHQEVYESWHYEASEIKFNRHFVPCFSYNGASSAVTIEMRNFQATSEDADFNVRFRVKSFFIGCRRLIRSRIAIKEWFKAFILDVQRVHSIVNAAMDQNLHSLAALAKAGRETLLELGITKEIDAVMNALERHKEINEEKEEESKSNDVDESKENDVEEYKEESPALIDSVKTEV